MYFYFLNIAGCHIYAFVVVNFTCLFNAKYPVNRTSKTLICRKKDKSTKSAFIYRSSIGRTDFCALFMHKGTDGLF